jgi:hypothetical protein
MLCHSSSSRYHAESAHKRRPCLAHFVHFDFKGCSRILIFKFPIHSLYDAYSLAILLCFISTCRPLQEFDYCSVHWKGAAMRWRLVAVAL